MPDDPKHCMDHASHVRAISTHDKRLDSHSATLDQMSETLVTLREIERQNQRRIDALESALADLAGKPGRRWEALVTQAITLITGAVFGLVISNFNI